MPLPISIPIPPEAAVASYDFTDIAEGTGVIKFKGFNFEASGGVASYAMSTQDIYSAKVATQIGKWSGTGSSWSLRQNMNFDLVPFNAPKIIKGTATIEGTFGVQATGVNDVHSQVIFNIQHWDGTTAITLGTAATEILDAATVGWIFKTFVLTAPLDNTHFKKGDTLRVNAQLLGMMDTGDPTDCDMIIGHDPQNRDYTSGALEISATASHTILNFYIPFNLDL